MAFFGQQTRLIAANGYADALVAKFLEAADMQREDPACLMMVASKSPEDDVVYLFEVWSSEAEWDLARTSPAIAAWAEGMETLVASPPASVRFTPVGGIGLSR